MKKNLYDNKKIYLKKRKELLSFFLILGLGLTKVNGYSLLDRFQIGIDLMTEDEQSLK